MENLKKNEQKHQKIEKTGKNLKKMNEKTKFYIKLGVLFAIVVAVLVLDLVTKYVLDAKMDFEHSWVVIPKLFNFKLVHNFGAAWGMMAGKQAFLIVFSIVFLAIFAFYFCKEKNKTWLLTVAFALLVGGCLGNLFDRIFLGFVRDFIQFDFWQTFPVFNFADVALTFGVLLFVIYLVLYFVRAERDKKSLKMSENDKTDLIIDARRNSEQNTNQNAEQNAKRNAEQNVEQNANQNADKNVDINADKNANHKADRKAEQKAEQKADTTSTNLDDENEQN